MLVPSHGRPHAAGNVRKKAVTYPGLLRLLLLAGSMAHCVGRVLSTWARQMLGKRVRGTCVVLFYHAVPSEYRQTFARHMDDICRWARPLSADFTGPLADGVHHVAVTLDDGYQSVVDNALPELRKRRIPSTMFIVTGNLGQKPRWRLTPDSPCAGESIISAEQLRRLPRDLVTIGAHTVTHPRCESLDEEAAWEELTQSRKSLESLLKRRVTLFAFPYGTCNQKLVDLSRKAGYQRVFTSYPRLALSRPTETVTDRLEIKRHDWRIEFRLKMMGDYCWIMWASALKRKIADWLRGDVLGSPG